MPRRAKPTTSPATFAEVGNLQGGNAQARKKVIDRATIRTAVENTADMQRLDGPIEHFDRHDG